MHSAVCICVCVCVCVCSHSHSTTHKSPSLSGVVCRYLCVCVCVQSRMCVSTHRSPSRIGAVTGEGAGCGLVPPCPDTAPLCVSVPVLAALDPFLLCLLLSACMAVRVGAESKGVAGAVSAPREALGVAARRAAAVFVKSAGCARPRRRMPFCR